MGRYEGGLVRYDAATDRRLGEGEVVMAKRSRRSMYEGVTCKMDGCKKQATTLGYCQNHYKQLRMQGKLDYVYCHSRSKYNNVKCKVEGCDKQAHARGWCRNHYSHWQTYGTPLSIRPQYDPVCLVPDCDNPSRTRGYCKHHYYRFQYWGDATRFNPNWHRKQLDRNTAIVILYDAGYTLDTVAKLFGITRERVRQIVKREREGLV